MLTSHALKSTWLSPEKYAEVKEFDSMHDLKMAVVALDVCIKKVFWWNCSFATVAIFLNTIEFGESDLAGFSDRLTIVADFIDEILKFNAQAWDEERYFMSAQEVSTKWSALLVRKNVSRSAKTSSTVSRKKKRPRFKLREGERETEISPGCVQAVQQGHLHPPRVQTRSPLELELCVETCLRETPA